VGFVNLINFLPFGMLLACAALAVKGEDVLFRDDFAGRLQAGWSWVREHPQAWRVTEQGLEVRIEPGNMWGPQNDGRNVLVRPAPPAETNRIEITVTVEHHPTNQYEQVDLVWYYDDSNMIKLGEELVDGKLSVVMGREEKDKTRTIAIIPLPANSVQLRLEINGDRLHGKFHPLNAKEWVEAGSCELLPLPREKAKIALQCYQGTEEAEHWARITGFVVRRQQSNTFP
jgi:regulation of enolase protein 1 (concanavalin A-like superfamily)